MLSDERIRQIAMEYWSGVCGTRVPDMEQAIRAALAEAAKQTRPADQFTVTDSALASSRSDGELSVVAAQSPAVPVMGEPLFCVSNNGMNPELFYFLHDAESFRYENQKSHDLSGSLAHFRIDYLYRKPATSITQAELDALRKELAHETAHSKYLAEAVTRQIEERIAAENQCAHFRTQYTRAEAIRKEACEANVKAQARMLWLEDDNKSLRAQLERAEKDAELDAKDARIRELEAQVRNLTIQHVPEERQS